MKKKKPKAKREKLPGVCWVYFRVSGTPAIERARLLSATSRRVELTSFYEDPPRWIPGWLEPADAFFTKAQCAKATGLVRDRGVAAAQKTLEAAAFRIERVARNLDHLRKSL